MTAPDIKVLKALASEPRVKLLHLLGEKPVALNDLVRDLGHRLKQPVHRDTVFRQLQILVDADLCEKYYDKGSKRIMYKITAPNAVMRVGPIIISLRVDPAA